MKKPKILHILFSGLGGHASVFESMVKADKERRFSYHAVFYGLDKLREEIRMSCENLSIPSIFIKKKRGLDLKIFVSALQEIRKANPDLIFLHGVMFVIPAIIYKIFYKKVKVVVRDTQVYHLKSKIEVIELGFALLLADVIVFMTVEAADLATKKFWGIGRKRVKIIPNSVDMEEYTPIAGGIDNGVFRLGMQSRLELIKDHPSLIRAVAMLRRKYPDRRMELKIAGDGDTMQNLKALVSELQLEKEVIFTGMLPKEKIIPFLQELDVYVHATYGESMSNAIIQAMACGIPVVASNVRGVDNMLTHGQNAFLYESENVEDLVDKLSILLTDEEKRSQLGKQARAHAVSHYSNNVNFRKYLDLFDV